MKLIHCADLHLDSSMESGLSKEKAKERRQELLQTFTHMIEEAERKQIDAVLLCGDVFDKKTISARAVECVSDAIKQHPHMRFYFLQGNHDQNSFLDYMDEKPQNLKTFGKDWTYYEEDDDVVIAGADISENAVNTLSDGLSLDRNRINIVMLHGQITEYDSGNSDDSISLRTLKGKNINYLALGHIHSYRQDKLDERGVWCYSGCLEGRGFDECGKKGYVLLETGNGTVKSEFVPFAYRTIHEKRVDISDCFTYDEICRRIPEELGDVPQDDMVRVTLVGEVGPEVEKNPELIKRWLDREKKYYLLKVKDETSLALNPEDYQYDVSLKGEFVRLVMDSELAQEEKEQVLRMGIRALAGRE